jgi:DNA-binding SARP family transcriptional activator
MTNSEGTACPGTTLRVQLLGPVRAWRGEAEIDVGGPQRRAVLGMLATARHTVSQAELIDGLWGLDAPPSAGNSVHVQISALRRALEPDRVPRARSQLLTVGQGYRLYLGPGTLDIEVLSGHLATAQRLAGNPEAAGLPGALQSLDAALGLWQGAPLDGIRGPWADAERARLEELRQAAIADRVDILLRLGGHQRVLADLTALIRRYPLDERFRGQLMLALYRCGRQADALAAFTRARQELAEQLGIDPGPALRLLHQQILAADPVLDPPMVTSSATRQPPRAARCALTSQRHWPATHH